MIGHDQHRNSLADMGMEQLDESIDLRLEARRDVVNRGEQETLHRASYAPPRLGCPIKKASLEVHWRDGLPTP